MLGKVMMLHNLSNNRNCRRISTIECRPSYIHFSYLASMLRMSLRCGRMMRLIRTMRDCCTISMLSCCADWDAIKIQWPRWARWRILAANKKAGKAEGDDPCKCQSERGSQNCHITTGWHSSTHSKSLLPQTRAWKDFGANGACWEECWNEDVDFGQD